MPARACTVSFIGTGGIRHGVEVEAESVRRSTRHVFIAFDQCRIDSTRCD